MGFRGLIDRSGDISKYHLHGLMNVLAKLGLISEDTELDAIADIYNVERKELHQ